MGASCQQASRELDHGGNAGRALTHRRATGPHAADARQLCDGDRVEGHVAFYAGWSCAVNSRRTARQPDRRWRVGRAGSGPPGEVTMRVFREQPTPRATARRQIMELAPMFLRRSTLGLAAALVVAGTAIAYSVPHWAGDAGA